MGIITKGMGVILKAKKAKGQNRIKEINKELKKSKNKQATTEKYIDEVKDIYDKNK
tara:strand:+ start:99 stop:266 length:168 start_codon:yes stop_codon:yes gene_type:complete